MNDIELSTRHALIGSSDDAVATLAGQSPPRTHTTYHSGAAPKQTPFMRRPAGTDCRFVRCSGKFEPDSLYELSFAYFL